MKNLVTLKKLEAKNEVSLDGIIRRVHCKYNCIAVNFEETQHGIFVMQIGIICEKALPELNKKNNIFDDPEIQIAYLPA